jgi:hypothetical protein
MKVYLDDERTAPEGWVQVKTPAQAIALLETGEVSHLSLDHDLGDDEGIGTGYDVVLWMEERVYGDIHYPMAPALRAILYGNFRVPENITVHTANVSARVKMEQGIKKLLGGG